MSGRKAHRELSGISLAQPLGPHDAYRIDHVLLQRLRAEASLFLKQLEGQRAISAVILEETHRMGWGNRRICIVSYGIFQPG